MISVNIEFEEGNKTYDFPTSWDEITVEQFVKIYETAETDHDGIMGSVKLISAISNISEDILLMMDIEDFKNLAENFKFINQELTKTDVEYIEINGEKYYLYTEFNKFTTGEIISIELLLERAGGNIFPVILDLLCLFLRKKKDDGTFEKYSTTFQERKSLFKDVKISQIFHIFTFFLGGKNLFKENIKEFSVDLNQK
jgi:hypothetical protein